MNGHDQEHHRRHERTERLIEALAIRQEKTEDELRTMLRSQVLMGENMGQIVTHLGNVGAHLERLDTHLEKVDIRLEEATAKMDALIDIVDRHVRDDKRHN